MSIKPSPTIAGKLRKLFSNSKQTIEQSIGDNASGDILKIYIPDLTSEFVEGYIDPQFTRQFSNAEEAIRACERASRIQCQIPLEGGRFGTMFACGYMTDIFDTAYLWVPSHDAILDVRISYIPVPTDSD